jgi:putative transposase
LYDRQGVVLGKTRRTTTRTSPLLCQPTSCNATSRFAPNQLWVADLTYVATWSGFVYTSFVIDALANLRARSGHINV